MTVEYEGIAIIGMAGRFPGAESVEEFWANLVAGKETVSFFTDQDLAESGFSAEELRRHGRYVPARGILNNADCFDAAFFGVHPKEAEVMEPQQRVFLETCWAALERAGYAPDRLSAVTGIFAGESRNTYYLHALYQRPDLIELIGAEMVMYGNEKDYLTTRVAYKLGLKGPALNVSTACSTSLVAIGQAVQSLLTYQCDMALAGGVSVMVPQKRGYYFDEGNIGSSDGHTRTFDAQAAGTVFSNGVAVVVLKRLADAVKDGDQIYAVIKGAALNNDGSQRVSFGAPGVEGQSEVIAMAHALAGVEPDTITCVEAHGTATPLGDPIEIAGLTKAFRLGTDAKQFCAIGSVKSNIGHLDVAAGAAGLIKMALSLHNKIIPASLHFTASNPKLNLEESPFYVNASLQEWKAKPGVPRRGGVSSFGTGGTNAHIVLEEAPELPASGPSRPWQLFPVSAKTPEALDRATANLSEYLKSLAQQGNADKARAQMADAAFTLQTGRSEFNHRRIVVCQEPAEGAAVLDARDAKRVFTARQQLNQPPVVFMFPGQGAQYAGMGAAIYRTEPVFRAVVDRCAEILRPILNRDIREVIFPADNTEKSQREAEELLVQTRFTQPALFVIEYALAQLWMAWGIHPSSMIGHSVGEYVAACVAGVFSLEDALSLVARRGALVQSLPGGAMLVVRAAEKDVTPLLNSDLAVAAVNSPGLCVVAGPHAAVEALEKQFDSRKIATRHLPTSHAFHSPMMEPALAPFADLLRQVKFADPQIPFVSNVTARWVTPEQAKSVEYWAGHLRQTVRFADGIGELLKDPRNVLLEVGPGQTLSTLARQHPGKSAEQVVLASLPLAGAQEGRGILESLGRLWMAGVEIDWRGFYADETRHRAVLPTYPFERTRYWAAPPAAGSHPSFASTVPVAAAANPSPSETTVHASAVSSSQQFAPVPPAVTQSAGPSPARRKERLLVAARALLQDLSGSDLSNVDTSSNLLELGLDSLLLTQASHLFQKKFGVPMSFRQLMEELSSLDEIAAYLDAKLPPDKFAAPAPAVASSGTVPAQVAATQMSPVLAGDTRTVLEQLLLQQQNLTNQVLQLLGRAPATLEASAAAAVPTVAPAATRTAEPFSAPLSGPTKSHGPFKPIDKSAGTLSTRQYKALDALITRYTRRTAASKKLAAQNRPVLADPRSVAGFNRLWKEMVYPISTTRSDGSRVWDVDANEYVDFVMGFGASMFGHRPPFVIRALEEQLKLGFEIGPIQPLAGEVAALIREFTGMERVGFTNTGSEAVLAATRVARTVTGRDKIAVFAGAYHGIFDEVLFRPLKKNGQAAAAPIAPGIPSSALDEVIVLDYGNPESLDIIRARGSEIAAVLVEPVQSRRLDLQPREFLHELRLVTEEIGSALIFDEVVTGFRLHPGGAQAYFNVRADLATYGKVIGGGLPIGAVTGSPKYMDALDGGQWQYGDTSFPEVGVTFFAGTFVRHPLALAAAKAVLTYLKAEGPQLQQRLSNRAAQLADEMRAAMAEFEAPYNITQFTSLLQLGLPHDQKFAALLFYFLRERGIHIWENRAFVLTTAHSEEDFSKLDAALRESLAEMRVGEFLPPPSGSSGKPRGLSSGHRVESESVEPLAPIPVAQDSLETEFPLTEAQTEIWLAAHMSTDAAIAYNESISLDFSGDFDAETFRASVQQVVQRHPILLASISSDGHSQCVQPGTKIEIPVIDLEARPGAEQQAELAKLVDAETREPFDLAAGPLLRVKIVRFSPDHHVVIWTAHHMVCDGWSGGLLIGEIAQIYSAAKKGVPPALEAPLSFRKYVEGTGPETAGAKDAVAYWTTQYKDLPAPLDLPVDHARPPLRSSKASTTKRNLDASLHKSLKRVAGQQRTTLVVLLMAVLKTLLYRLTGQEDIVVGLGAAGQAMTGETCLVGHCLNLLPIRTHLRADATFQENLVSVKKSVLDAYDHHECTLGTLLQHLSIPRNPGRSPLVEVLFNLDKDPGSSEFSGLKFSCDRNPKRALHFDLFFNFVESASSLVLECDYNSDLFEQATIDRWLRHFETLLSGIAASPSEALGKLPILTQQERQEITVGWNSTKMDYPLDRCLFEFVEQQVEQTPDAAALVFEGETLSYAQLNARANQLAHYLRGRGVGPEKLVAVCAERSLEMVVALLGIIKAGGAYVPVDPWNPKERLALLLDEVKAPVVLTQQRFVDRLPSSSPLLALDTQWSEILYQPEANPGRLTNASNAAYVIYTSGSTGLPKGVINTHRGIVNRLLWMQDGFKIGSGDRVLQKTPFTFDVSVWEFFWPLMTGACLVVARPEGHKDPDYLVSIIASERITTLHFVPSMLEIFIEARGLEAQQSLVRVICSGEALSRATQERFFERLPETELHNLYGPTEAAVDVTHWPCQKDSHLSVVPIGKPVANTQIYVVDRYMNPTPIGVSGELHIGGVQVARGYLNRPELTAERFIRDCFSDLPGARLYKTGDLVRYLSDGNMEYLGRADHQVKIRGFRIELGDIEATLQRHTAVRETVVVAREDEPGQKQLVAYIVPKSGAVPEPESLRQHLRQSLPDYMVPSAFVLLEKFTLTSSGKVDRKALPAPSGDSALDAQNLVEPRTETERAVAAIWCEILKLQKVGAESNFFDIGGHSLLAIRVVSRIRDQFQVDLSPRVFFANATVAALAHEIDQAKGVHAAIQKIPRRKHMGPSPLSFAQARLWFLDQLATGSPVYNIVDIVEFARPANSELIKRAVNELVSRHEILHTAFSESEGDPVQFAQPSVDVALPEIDLSGLPSAQKEAEWTRIAREQGRTPFDLAKPPLFRATLVHLGEQEYLLLLALHHIIADEWSMEVLHRDLHKIYGAFFRNRPSSLPELPIQFADFATWEREWLSGDVLGQQASYWKAELAGAPTVLELATDKPRPAVQSFRGAAASMKFPKELSEPIKALGREEKATLFMVFMAAFMALMNRYTGQSDILVGSPISARTLSETEDLIGFFLNTIVLRAQFDDGISFRSLLRQVKERALGAYAHQDFPFGNLVAALAPDRDPSHSPLIQVMFILQNAEAVSQASRLAGIQKLETGTSKFDLTLFMSETPEGFEGLVEYSTDLFKPATIQRLLKHYETLLQSIARNPDEAVARLPIFSADERGHLLEELNQTAVVYAEREFGLHQLFEQQARKTPDRIAVSFEKRRISYRDLDEHSTQLANYLKTCGVGADSLVGVLLERSSEMVVALLAILKAGGAYVPIDPSFPQNRIAHMVEDSRIRVLLTHHRLDEALPVRPETVVRLDADADKIAKQSAASPALKVNAGQLAYVLYTSGSTGKPKGVEIPHSAIVNFLLSMRSEPGFSSDDTLLAVTTLSFDIAGLELYLPLISGGKLVIATRDETHDPSQLMERIRESACTVMQATPATWRSLIDAGWNGSSKLKILCGGEAFPADLAVELLPRCAELWNMYGPTETTVWSTVHKVTSVGDFVPIGHPIANTQVFVLDAYRNLLPKGAIGELYIGGSGIANGYLRRPELTRERFVDNPFAPHSRLYRTGDLARWLPDGTLECLGRADNQVKIRGFRIELGEIEAVLARHESIAQGVVAARDTSSGDKILVAYFESKPGPSPDVTELRNHLKKDLPDYMIPSAFVRMDKFPLTANGKIDRKALPSPDNSRVEVGVDFVAPRDYTEQALAQLWSRVLKVDRVGVRDDFFALGGHSLLALRIVVEIEKQFKRRLPLATLLQSPTVADLADVLRMPEKNPSWASLVRIKPGGARPPLFLMHSHGGNVLEYYPLANLLDPDQPVYGVQALGLDGRIQRNQSVEKIISIYLQEIRILQPRGPYLLGGFCFGGLLALEAARQLNAVGEEVSAVILLQTMHPDAAQFESTIPALRRAWYRAAKRIDLERENLAYRGGSYFHERFGYGLAKVWARTAIAVEKLRGNGNADKRENGNNALKPRSMPYILESLTLEHDRMAEEYEVRPYRGNVILFRASKQLTGLVADDSLGWKNVITGNLDICEVPGHQQNILLEPNVSHLAAELSSRLRRLYQSVAAD